MKPANDFGQKLNWDAEQVQWHKLQQANQLLGETFAEYMENKASPDDLSNAVDYRLKQYEAYQRMVSP